MERTSIAKVSPAARPSGTVTCIGPDGVCTCIAAPPFTPSGTVTCIVDMVVGLGWQKLQRRFGLGASSGRPPKSSPHGSGGNITLSALSLIRADDGFQGYATVTRIKQSSGRCYCCILHSITSCR